MDPGPGLEAGAASTTAIAPEARNKVNVALVLGLLSLFGFVFPPCLGLGIAGLVIGWRARHAGRVAYLAVALSAAGTLVSLLWPGVVVYVWIYAAFHGGQLPPGA